MHLDKALLGGVIRPNRSQTLPEAIEITWDFKRAYPFGRASQLEVALFMAHTAHLTYPDELETVFDMVTVNAARAMRLPRYGLAPGDAGDLLVWDAGNVKEALTRQRPPASVIRGGAVVARTTIISELT